MGTQGGQLLEFDHIPDKPRNFIVCATITESDFGALFGMPPEFIPTQKLGLMGAQYMFSDKMIDLTEVNNGQEMKFSLRAATFNRHDTGTLELILTNIPQSVFSARELEAIVAGSFQNHIENSNLEPIPIGLEGFFAGEDSECTIGQAIDSLNRIVEENMNIVFSQAGKNSKYYTNLCKESGCIIFGQRNVKVQIKHTAGLPSQASSDFSNTLSIYRKTTYDGKKITQIL